MDRPILDEVKEHGNHGYIQFVANDIFYEVSDEDKKLFHQAWIGRDDMKRGPHWHCGQCYSDEWMMVDNGIKVCKKCYLKGSKEQVFLCTPVICGSS